MMSQLDSVSTLSSIMLGIRAEWRLTTKKRGHLSGYGLARQRHTPRLITGRGGRTLAGKFVWTVDGVLVTIGGA
jgi:hypothetical protein